MKRLFVLVCALGLWAAAWAAPEVNIVPKPLNVETGDGSFTVDAATVVTVGRDASLRSVGELFAAMIEPVTGRAVKVKTAADGAKIDLAVDPELGEEEYVLRVTPAGADVRGGSPKGVLYGLQSLRQLVIEGEGTVPAVTVKDKPYFGYRGAMLDVCRHFMPVEDVKAFIDILAMHKLNRFHFHLTDDQGWRIEIKKYPELAEIGGQLPNNGRKGGYYTQEEFKDLVNYAKERFITIIPEVDIPGHTAAIFAAYPDFKNAVKFKTNVNIPGQAFNALDVDDPKAMQFTEDVIAELAALAPGNYIHIGGDEAIGLPHDKFVRFINKTREIVLKNGKKMVGWQETARADISEGDVIQHWIYLKQKNEDSSKKKDNIPAEYKEIMALFAEFMKEAPKDPGLGISKKAKVILSPSGYVYLDHKYLEPSADSTQNAEQERLGMAAYEKQTIQEMYDWDPMTFNPTVENPQKDVAGIEAAIWCETITNFRDLQFLLMPRLAGVAEKGWSKVENTHWDEYKVRLGAQAPLWEKADWNYFKSSLVDWK